MTTMVRCGCGYDLEHHALGEVCPECGGTVTERSLVWVMERSLLSKLNLILAVPVWVAASVALAYQSTPPLLGLAFMLPFAMSPHAVSHVLSFRLKSRAASALLGVGMLAYLAWFFYLYLDAFYWHLDAQSSLLMLFVGIYSLPVMAPLWGAAIWMERVAKRKHGRLISASS